VIEAMSGRPLKTHVKTAKKRSLASTLWLAAPAQLIPMVARAKA